MSNIDTEISSFLFGKIAEKNLFINRKNDIDLLWKIKI